MIRKEKSVIKQIEYSYQLKSGYCVTETLESKEEKLLIKKIKEKDTIEFKTVSGHTLTLEAIESSAVTFNDNFKGSDKKIEVSFGSFEEINTKIESDLFDLVRIYVK